MTCYDMSTLDARNAARRCTTVTEAAVLARTSASSIAASPPVLVEYPSYLASHANTVTRRLCWSSTPHSISCITFKHCHSPPVLLKYSYPYLQSYSNTVLVA